MFELSTCGIHLQDFRDLPNEDEAQKYADEVATFKSNQLEENAKLQMSVNNEEELLQLEKTSDSSVLNL